MNRQSIREIFDNISLSVISFLENHVGIADVEFVERTGKSPKCVLTLFQASQKSPSKSGRKKTNLINCLMTTRRSSKFQMASR